MYVFIASNCELSHINFNVILKHTNLTRLRTLRPTVISDLSTTPLRIRYNRSWLSYPPSFKQLRRTANVHCPEIHTCSLLALTAGRKYGANNGVPFDAAALRTKWTPRGATSKIVALCALRDIYWILCVLMCKHAAVAYILCDREVKHLLWHLTS